MLLKEHVDKVLRLLRITLSTQCHSEKFMTFVAQTPMLVRMKGRHEDYVGDGRFDPYANNIYFWRVVQA